MKWFILLFLCFPAMAIADDICIWQGMWIRVEEAPHDTARVTFHNYLTTGIEQSIYQCDVRIRGLMIKVVVDAGDGELPDQITVTPPPGYSVTDNDIMVPEDKTVVIDVVPLLLG